MYQSGCNCNTAIHYRSPTYPTENQALWRDLIHCEHRWPLYFPQTSCSLSLKAAPNAICPSRKWVSCVNGRSVSSSHSCKDEQKSLVLLVTACRLDINNLPSCLSHSQQHPWNLCLKLFYHHYDHLYSFSPYQSSGPTGEINNYNNCNYKHTLPSSLTTSHVCCVAAGMSDEICSD